MYSIKIKQWPVEVIASKKESMLDASLRAGVPFPHSCRSGECGECKVKLLAGEINHDHYLDGALSQAERDDGYVLACRSRPLGHVDIAWIKELDTEICIPVRKYKAVITQVEKMAHNVTRVRAKIKGTPMAFVAGQYAIVSIGRYPARSYSMASLPSEDTMEFHIRHVPQGVVSSYIAEHLSVGEKLKIEGPYGASYLRENHEGPIVAAAGGTGLAPVMSIVRQALLLKPERAIHLYFGVHDEAGIYCENELKQLVAQHSNVNLQIVLSDTNAGHARRKGYLHNAIAADIPDMQGAKIYAAGPPPMIDALLTVLKSKGVVEKDIHNDPFTASGNEKFARKAGLMAGIARLFSQS